LHVPKESFRAKKLNKKSKWPMRYSDNSPNLASSSPLLLGTNSCDMYPAHFINMVQSSVTRTHTNHAHVTAVIIVSIDNLNMILSGYGHETTEAMLTNVLNNINEMLSNEDMAIRLQKDQLAVLVQADKHDIIRNIAERIQQIIQQTGYHSMHDALHLMHSIVCITVTPECKNAEELLNYAFIALRSTQNHNLIIFKNYENTSVESAKSRQEMGLANYLQRGLKENRLRMAYQPVIRSKDGKIAHYEALLRVVGDDGNISSAGPLIPVAERMGLIHAIDDFVMRKVIEEVENAPDVHLAFNVSNITTENHKWLENFQHLLAGKPEVAQRVMVEITETAIHHDLKRTAYFVAAIQSTGAQVALDDFGSGYTSFRQLKALSVDVVKIDGAFVRDLPNNPDNRFFVRTLMEFVHGFGLTAVAEYVENGEIAKILMEMGVDYMQGYYFGKPENHRSWRTQ
jgi:diguanylate cyclase (GGDEF)-like protein